MMVWAFGLILPMFVAVGLWVGADVLRVMGLFDPSNVGSIAHLWGIGVGIVFGFGFRFFGKKVRVEKKVDVPEEYVEGWEEMFMS